MILGRKETCCGCGVCAFICPKEAIKMTADNEGFLYPLVDRRLCVNCNKCIQICQFKKDLGGERE